MQAGKRQMRLGLHAGRGQHGHAAVVRDSGGLRQQPRLADAGLAAKHERPTAGRDLVHERREQGLLRGTADQRHSVAARRVEHQSHPPIRSVAHLAESNGPGKGDRPIPSPG